MIYDIESIVPELSLTLEPARICTDKTQRIDSEDIPPELTLIEDTPNIS